MTDINAAILARRRQLYMTQDLLAGAAQVSRSTVQRVERGLSISDESMRSLCAVLGIMPGDLHPAVAGPGTSAPGAADGSSPGQDGSEPPAAAPPPTGWRRAGLLSVPFVLGIALFGFAALVKADFGRRAAEEAMAAEGRVAAIVAADAYPVTVAASDGSCAVAVSVRSCLADEASARAAGQVAWKNAAPDARRACEPSLRVREARASALLDCLDGGR